MKLSEVKGERTLDVLGDVIGPVFDIVADKKMQEEFAAYKDDSGKLARNLIPYLLKQHRAEIIQILAAIEGTTTEEYESGLTLAKLLKDVYEVFTDEELLAFLS